MFLDQLEEIDEEIDSKFVFNYKKVVEEDNQFKTIIQKYITAYLRFKYRAY